MSALSCLLSIGSPARRAREVPPARSRASSSSPSMPHQKPSPSRVSIRRFSSRHTRPSIVSVADLFVGSLILAGYCHEHSPRCRNLSAIPPRISGSQLRTYRRESVTEGDGYSAPKPWPCSGPWPRLQSSQDRHQLSTASTRAGHEHESNHLPLRTSRETGSQDAEGASTASVSPDKSKSLLTIWHQYFDPKTPNHPSHPDNQISDVSDYPNTPGEPLSYDERRYLSTASVYRRILGEEYDWQEAVKLVLPHPHPPRLVEGKYDYDVESPSVAELIEAVHSNPKNTSQYLFSLYRNIPSPGVEKLPSRTRGALLRQMANPPNRRPVDVRRYLALVDDMIACNIPMSRSLWTTAISFAGRRSGKGRTKKRNIVRAIGLWQQMEHHANIEADEVVFNVLYDSAIKAGAFSIAERLEQEMIKREIPSTRYSLIPKLYYHAERQDLEGISRTFDDFVQSGNIVDTVILNGLLSAFLKAGDTETAEGIYERMLLAQNTRKNTSLPADITGHSLSTRFEIYRSTTKRLGRLLKLSDALKDHLPNHYRAFQESLPLTPDTRTFHILLRHYAITTGRFDKVLYIIRDMENTFKSPPRHMIYSTLFEGFSIHGKTKKQTWTANRLWLLWHSYVWALIDSRKSQDKLLPRLFNFGRPAQPSNTWVNPFRDEMDSVEAEAKSAKSADEKAEVAQTKGRLPATQNKAEATDELYMPLPSVDPNPEQNTSGKLETEMTFIESHAHADPHDQPGIKGKGDVIKQELSMEEYQRSEFLLNSKYLDNDLQDPELEHASRLEGNVENGVFVGRSTIIHVLRAFGTCTHPDDVIEAWEQLQQLWDPFHRNAVDVSIIRDELERQLQKNPL
ncbi:hypothetical protein N7533_002496 [Penicillium manginii]|uniref:uncharacterized protein n=1 Tax=Penicillium manginii TaxID=203109 RepID=UPI002548313A|nr:uncharacterized protein N7533_002496 [Penicillium manginii]KAJ5763815.1 hypothetical protein N7533_002496 [Penicillium manginii]